MKEIFEPAVRQEIAERISRLQADQRPLWGQMQVDQMLQHTQRPLKVAMGEMEIRPKFMLRILGPFFKDILVGPKPYRQSITTLPEYKITSSASFEQSRQDLLALLDKVYAYGPEAMSKRRHPVFGPLTPKEWGVSHYKHLDHHLRQFGV
jgi:Protein of unknown function (DUF1569)